MNNIRALCFLVFLCILQYRINAQLAFSANTSSQIFNSTNSPQSAQQSMLPTLANSERETEYQERDISTNSFSSVPLNNYTSGSFPYFRPIFNKSPLTEYGKIPKLKLLSQLLTESSTNSPVKSLYKSHRLSLPLLIDTCFLETSAPVELPQNDAQISESNDDAEQIKRSHFVVSSSDMEPEVGQLLPSPLFPRALNLNNKNTGVKTSPCEKSAKSEEQQNNVIAPQPVPLQQLDRWFPVTVPPAPLPMGYLPNPSNYGLFPSSVLPMPPFLRLMLPHLPQPLEINNQRLSIQPPVHRMVSSAKNFHAKIPQLAPPFSPYKLANPAYRLPLLPSESRLLFPPLKSVLAFFSLYPEFTHLFVKPEQVHLKMSSLPFLSPALQNKFADFTRRKIYPTLAASKSNISALYPVMPLQNPVFGIHPSVASKAFNNFHNLPFHMPPIRPLLSLSSDMSPIPSTPTTSLMSDRNMFLWPNFPGVKRFPFAPLCQGRTTFAFGSCSPFYLSCDSRAQQYSFEECPPGQVYASGQCQLAPTECFHLRIFRLNMETQYLMEDTHFCMQGEGIYVTSLNQCSRQAIVCTDYYHGFGISCAHDHILSAINMECVPSPTVCSSWTLPPIQFAPWKFLLINYYCQLMSDDNHLLTNNGHYEHYCRNWYVDCRSMVRDIIMCEQGQIYDPQNRRCRLSTAQDPCFLPPISCGGNNWYNIGLGQCMGSFVRCESGLIRKYLCSDGMVFHEGKCVHPLLTSGACSVCTQGQTNQFSHEKCNQYSVCESGRWVQRLCPYGQAYSTAQAGCVQDSSCTRFIGSCAGGKRIRISCNEYMECSWDGHYHKKICPLLHSWNVEQQRCVFDTTCSLGAISSCNEGQIIESWDCQHYFQCKDGHWEKFLCSSGLKIGGCRRCLSGAYQRQLGAHLECINGRTQHDLSNCVFYRRCVDGQWKQEQCLNGFMWNQKRGRCDLFSDCPHYRRADCVEMERIAYFDGVNCDGYFECSKGLWSLYQCPSGHIFDPRVNRCMRSYAGCAAVGNLPLHPIIRPPIGNSKKFGLVTYYPGSSKTSTPVNCEIGSFLPDDYDCSRYYTCTKTGLIASACLPNMSFNPASRLCERTFRCDATKCVDGQLKPGSACGQYLQCSGGEWLPKKCPGTQYFAEGKCHLSFGQCGMLPHSKCFNGQVMPIDVDCSSYLVCQDGLFQRRHCQHGTFFNPTSRYCSPSYTCPYCADGQIKPYRNHCSDYLLCISGHFERKSCPANQHFEVTKLRCIPGSCKISAAEMETCLESPGPLGYRPHPNVKGSFMQCAHGKWVTKPCPPGLLWNQSKLICDWPRDVV